MSHFPTAIENHPYGCVPFNGVLYDPVVAHHFFPLKIAILIRSTSEGFLRYTYTRTNIYIYIYTYIYIHTHIYIHICVLNT